MSNESNNIRTSDSSPKIERSDDRLEGQVERKVRAEVTPEAREELKDRALLEKLQDEKLRKLTPQEAEVLAARGQKVIGDATKQQGGRVEVYSRDTDGAEKTLIQGLSRGQVTALTEMQMPSRSDSVPLMQDLRRATDHNTPPSVADNPKDTESRTYAGKAQYRVRPGDTIFEIADRHLPPDARPAQIEAYTRKIMRANGITDASALQIGQSLELPEDHPKVMSSSEVVDAQVARLENLPRNYADTAELASARRRLLEDSKSFKSKDEQVRFFQSMEKFEKRTNSPDSPITQHELAKVYRDLSDILRLDDTRALMKSKERRQLVQHFMYNCGAPETITQGEHPTCNTTCMQNTDMTRQPSVLSDMVKQVSQGGHWLAHDGKTINLDPRGLSPVNESRQNPPDANHRSFSTQIINEVIINDLLQRQVPPRSFYEKPVDKAANEPFSGDIVLDNAGRKILEDSKGNQAFLDNYGKVHRNINGHEYEIDSGGHPLQMDTSGHLSPVSIPHFTPEPIENFNTPGLDLAALDLNSGYGGESGYNKRVMVNDNAFTNTSWEYKDHYLKDYLVHFNSPATFRTELERAKTEGRLPITLDVDLENFALHEKGRKIDHVINVTRVFNDGTVEVYDPQSDFHQMRKFRMPISRLYESTLGRKES